MRLIIRVAAADHQPEPQVLPHAPRRLAVARSTAADRGRRRRSGPSAGQHPGEELHPVRQQAEGESRRQGVGRDGHIPAVHDDETGQPGLHPRDQRQDGHRRLHRDDERTRGPAARTCHSHREKGLYRSSSSVVQCSDKTGI